MTAPTNTTSVGRADLNSKLSYEDGAIEPPQLVFDLRTPATGLQKRDAGYAIGSEEKRSQGVQPSSDHTVSQQMYGPISNGAPYPVGHKQGHNGYPAPIFVDYEQSQRTIIGRYPTGHEQVHAAHYEFGYEEGQTGSEQAGDSSRHLGIHGKGRAPKFHRHSPYPGSRQPDIHNLTKSPAGDFWTPLAEALVTSLIEEIPQEQTPGVCSRLKRQCFSRLGPNAIEAIGKFQLWIQSDEGASDPWIMDVRFEVYKRKNPDIAADQERAFKALFNALLGSATTLGVSTVAMEAEKSLLEISEATSAAERFEKERIDTEVADINDDFNRIV